MHSQFSSVLHGDALGNFLIDVLRYDFRSQQVLGGSF
jgi:hypothetical protein